MSLTAINVFSWALLQPAEDRYDFTMLDKIVALLVKHEDRKSTRLNSSH